MDCSFQLADVGKLRRIVSVNRLWEFCVKLLQNVVTFWQQIKQAQQCIFEYRLVCDIHFLLVFVMWFIRGRNTCWLTVTLLWIHCLNVSIDIRSISILFYYTVHDWSVYQLSQIFPRLLMECVCTVSCLLADCDGVGRASVGGRLDNTPVSPDWPLDRSTGHKNTINTVVCVFVSWLAYGWYIDSGATSHMTNDHNFFTEFSETKPVKVTVANGQYMLSLIHIWTLPTKRIV